MVVATGCAGHLERSRREQELLAVHQRTLEAHLSGDWAWFGNDTADPFLVGNHGEFRRLSPEDQRQRFRAYLSSVTFSDYRDVEPPVVHVSQDGNTGWVIARVHVAGTTNEGESFDTTFVWTMLYERRDGRWVRVANVSNQTPSPANDAPKNTTDANPSDAAAPGDGS